MNSIKFQNVIIIVIVMPHSLFPEIVQISRYLTSTQGIRSLPFRIQFRGALISLKGIKLNFSHKIVMSLHSGPKILLRAV